MLTYEIAGDSEDILVLFATIPDSHFYLRLLNPESNSIPSQYYTSKAALKKIAESFDESILVNDLVIRLPVYFQGLMLKIAVLHIRIKDDYTLECERFLLDKSQGKIVN